jgi:hypothetical protein
MCRSGKVVVAAALACAMLGTARPVAAETPREWFVEAKRIGKTIRIAHTTGRLDAVRDMQPVVRDLQLRVGLWPFDKSSGPIAENCRSLAAGLFRAVEAVRSRDEPAFERAMRHHDLLEDRCIRGINAAAR